MINKILKELEKYNITNKLEQAHFLTQCAHESYYFQQLDEQDKFTFARAKIVWPSRAALIETKQFELNAMDNDLCPQPWLFNEMYGTRMGNEDNGVDDNDGYDYRGSGMLQLTGLDMYTRFTKWLNNPAINIKNVRHYCLTEDGAIKSAIWVWKDRKVGQCALKDDIARVTKKINGGTRDVNARATLLIRYKKLLGV